MIEKRWQRWREQDPINLVAKYKANLKPLRGIYIDCGWRDQYHIHFGTRIAFQAARVGRRQAYLRGVRRQPFGRRLPDEREPAVSLQGAQALTAGSAEQRRHMPVIMSAMNTPPVTAHKPVDAPTKRGLFLGFLMVGLQGFGGVLPFARRMLVEQHRWLSEREFTEVLSLSQFLPGPNIVNVSIIVGNRFRGPLGSIAATLGLMLMPFVIVLVLAALYAQIRRPGAGTRRDQRSFGGRDGADHRHRSPDGAPLKGIPWHIVMCALTFIAIALLRLPLLWVLAVLAPISIAIARWMMPR